MNKKTISTTTQLSAKKHFLSIESLGKRQIKKENEGTKIEQRGCGYGDIFSTDVVNSVII